MRILVVGASGYVGGRLVLLLASRGHDLVLLARDPRAMAARFPHATVVRGDLDDPVSLGPALAGVDLVYCLARPGNAAATLEGAADAAGVPRIVRLGRLDRVDREPAAPGVSVTDFRAGVVVGSGSAAFEIIRRLVDRFPIVVAGDWIARRCQPIAIADVLDYLVGALDHPEIDGVVEIGGPDVLTFADLVAAYARQRGLRRRIVHLPLPTSRLSALWIGLISPIPAAVARPVIEAVDAGSVVHDSARALACGIRPLSMEAALRRAIDRTERHAVESTWFDAYRDRHRTTIPVSDERIRMLTDRRVVDVDAPAERVFAEVERVGGMTGWPYANILWRIRGLADRVVGGVGMRLGRRDPEHLRVGDAVDLWRVEEVRPPELLRLRDAMKLPGRAWLQYEVVRSEDGSRSTLIQTAYFEPHGIGGLLYWYGLMPVHPSIFRGMIGELAARAVASGTAPASV